MKIKESSANLLDDVPIPNIYYDLMDHTNDEADVHSVVFDLETKREPSEVGGWGNKDDMGVSVLCEYDSREGFNHYEEDELDDFVGKLMRADLVIGFNHEDFDYEVLSGLGYKKRNLHDTNSLDILKYINKRIGQRVKLEDLATRNFQADKLENGKFAPEMWRNGEYNRVARYCYSDVILTKTTFLFGSAYQFLMLPRYMSNKGQHSVMIDW